MKTITRDTVHAMFAKDIVTELKRCGYTDEDLASPEAFYNALHDAPELLPLRSIYDMLEFTHKDGKKFLLRRDQILRVGVVDGTVRIDDTVREEYYTVAETYEQVKAML